MQSVSENREGAGVYKMLDAWRGVAAFWVVMFHSATTMMHRLPGLQTHAIFAFSTYGDLGVQLFFVISGYCIANAACITLRRQKGIRSFMAARVRRIFPPCWWSLLFFALASIAASVLVKHGTLKSSVLASQDILHQGPLFFLSNLTMTQFLFRQTFLSIVCWTLCYEVAFYLIVAVAMRLAPRSDSERFTLNALHIVTIASLGILLMAPERSFYPLDLWPQFGLGVLAYDILSHPQEVRPRLWSIVILLLTTAFVTFHDLKVGYQGQSSRLMFLTCLFFALLLAAVYRYDARLTGIRVVRWFSTIGQFSYSLYLINFLIIGLMVQAMVIAGVLAKVPYLCFLLLLIIPVVVARGFYQFFERPFVKARPKLSPAPVPAE